VLCRFVVFLNVLCTFVGLSDLCAVRGLVFEVSGRWTQGWTVPVAREMPDWMVGGNLEV
jgi:hypothetical protein